MRAEEKRFWEGKRTLATEFERILPYTAMGTASSTAGIAVLYAGNYASIGRTQEAR